MLQCRILSNAIRFYKFCVLHTGVEQFQSRKKALERLIFNRVIKMYFN